MTLKINRKLHLVIPVEQGDKTLYVHSTPVGTETFDMFYLPIAKTFSAIYTEGLGMVAGPRIAAKLLRTVSESLNRWEEVQKGLVAEINRLTNVFSPTDTGWKMIPLDDAIRTNVIDAEDTAEVENAIVFFTLVSLMHNKTEREIVIQGAVKLWGARAELLNCTAFRDSLPILTNSGSIGLKVV